VSFVSASKCGGTLRFMGREPSSPEDAPRVVEAWGACQRVYPLEALGAGRYRPKHSESNLKHAKIADFDAEWRYNLGSIPKAISPQEQSPFRRTRFAKFMVIL